MIKRNDRSLVEDEATEFLREAEEEFSRLDPPALRKQVERARQFLAHPGLQDPDLRMSLLSLAGEGCFELGEIEESLREYEKIREVDPEEESVNYYVARALFHLWRFEEAEALLRPEPQNPELAGAVYYYRALLADRRGDGELADRWFRAAQGVNPEEFPLPVRFDPEEAHAALRDVLEELPRDVQSALENVNIGLQDYPNPKVHGDVDPLILGVYQGHSLMEGSVLDPADVSSIDLFQRNIELVVSSPEELHRELRTTLLHEIGHHLGWDEEDLHSRGLG